MNLKQWAREQGIHPVTAVYARVSSADQRPDLDRQVARVATWAAQEGLAVAS